jgi:23S rRNA (guanine745-N1)-methyltransferase
VKDGGVFLDVLAHLICPVCGGDLTDAGSAVRCPAGHSFDVARQGYVNLLAGAASPGTADTPAMVQARADFLAAGHYAPLTDALSRTVVPLAGAAPSTVVLDAGAGTGHYLAAALDAVPAAAGIALDVSKHALRRAARAHPRIGAAVADVWRPLPVRTGSVSVLLNVFAPRNGAEFRRVLRPDGALVVVTPAAGHLAELVGPLGLLAVDDRKDDRLAGALAPYFRAAARTDLTVPLRLSRVDAGAAARMGPSAHHLDAADLAVRLAALPAPVPANAAFTVSVYQPA